MKREPDWNRSRLQTIVASTLLAISLCLSAGCASTRPPREHIMARAEATTITANYASIVEGCLANDPNAMNSLFVLSWRDRDQDHGDPNHAYVLHALLETLGDRRFAKLLDFQTSEVQRLVKEDIVDDLACDPAHLPKGWDRDPLARERAKEIWPKTFPAASDEHVIEEIADFLPSWQEMDGVALPVAAGLKLNWRNIGKQCVAKDPVALHWMFWYCNSGDLDGALSEGYAGILHDLLENLGDRFYGACLSREPPEVQAQVRGQIYFDLGDEVGDWATMAHRRWPKTFPRG